MKRKKLLNPLFATDSYKHSHFGAVPEGTTLMYSHLTPRDNKRLLNDFPDHDGKVVIFGIQYLIQELLHRWDKGFFNRKWKKIEKETLEVLGHHLGFTKNDLVKFKELHELGYLPLTIKSIQEGELVNVGIPILTISNNHINFYWLTNFIESYILNTLYPALNAATITREFAKLRDQYYDLTVSDHSGKGFHLHNFSYRGCQSHESSAVIGAAHNLFTLGTDTLAGIALAQEYYGAQEVAYSVNACFDKETEILTSTGYKKFENLNPTDLIAQFTKDRKIEFVPFTNYIKQQYKGKMINFFNKNQNIDLLVTPNHKMVRYYKRHNKDEYQLVEASTPNIYKHPGSYLPLSGVCEQVGIEFTSLDQLKIAFQADGSFASHADDYTGTRSNTKPIRFHLKKQRKIDRLESILNTLGFKYTKSDLTPDGYVNFWISLPLEVFNTFSKTFDWVDISNVNANWASTFISELAYWDGHEPRENLITYSSIHKINTDVIQALAVLCDMSTKYNCITDSRTDFNRQDLHSIIIHKTRNTLNTNTFVQVEEDYDDYVYCVSVPSKMIVVRRNNKVAVCGNCEHSVVTLGINYHDGEDKLNGEYLNLRDLLVNKYPTGIFSYIADSYDYWSLINTILPNLKNEIMNRDGKLVIRGDSGSALHNICGYNIKDITGQCEDVNSYAEALHPSDEVLLHNGTYYLVSWKDQHWEDYDLTAISEVEAKGTIEALWNIFGGTVNDKGFKELDPHIGMIYGDGLTYKVVKQVYIRLMNKGFAISNICIALGAYVMSVANTRDTLSLAIKCSAATVNDSIVTVYKDPKTDSGKTSVKGLLQVNKDPQTGLYSVQEQVSYDEEAKGDLLTAYCSLDRTDVNLSYDLIKLKLSN